MSDLPIDNASSETLPVVQLVVTKTPRITWVVMTMLVCYLFYSQYLHNVEKERLAAMTAVATNPPAIRVVNKPTVAKTNKTDNRVEAETGYRVAREKELDCPIYKAPVVLPLPELPKEKLQNAKTEAEIITVLYDSIRDLQLYTEIHRQAIYDNYEAYLNACK